MKTGDQRRDEIVKEMAEALCEQWKRETLKPGEYSQIEEAADRVQNAADMLFHGGITALEDLIPPGAIPGSLVCGFVVELIIAEMLDHGFIVITEDGKVHASNKTVEKARGFVETRWLSGEDG